MNKSELLRRGPADEWAIVLGHIALVKVLVEKPNPC